jgi:hypothetical protein
MKTGLGNNVATPDDLSKFWQPVFESENKSFLQGLKPIESRHFTSGLKPRPPKEKALSHTDSLGPVL